MYKTDGHYENKLPFLPLKMVLTGMWAQETCMSPVSLMLGAQVTKQLFEYNKRLSITSYFVKLNHID